MNKIENEIPYGQILDDTNQLIQISDIDTLTMVYANMTARKFTNHSEQDYKGEKCHKYMMGLDAQCPFCPMLKMGEAEEFVTEIDNGQQVFTVKTKKTIIDGRVHCIEYATDVTAIRRAQQIFESQMKMLITSIPEAQGIFHLNLTQDKWLSSNGMSHNANQIQNMESVNSVIEIISSYVPGEIERKAFYNKFKRESLIFAYENGKTEVVDETKSYYDDRSIKWSRITARLIVNPSNGDLETVIYGMDISDEKSYKEKMIIAEHQQRLLMERSKRDMLTSVYTKKAFEEMAREYIENNSEQSFAVLFLDLDNFKNVNDILGHLIGDKVIIDTADKLQTIFKNKDIISRFGGDEFCVLIKDISYETLLDKLNFTLEMLNTEYSDNGESVAVSASIGATYCDGHSKSIFDCIQRADMALYKAKRNGRNQYQIL